MHLRVLILQRDAYRCQIAGPNCTKAATQVDHIEPLINGGDHHPDNLRAACANCNNHGSGYTLICADCGSLHITRDRPEWSK